MCVVYDAHAELEGWDGGKRYVKTVHLKTFEVGERANGIKIAADVRNPRTRTRARERVSAYVFVRTVPMD